MNLAVKFFSLFTIILLSVVSATASSTKRNGKIAFTSDRDGNPEIYLMDPDGSDQIRITNNDVVDDYPVWSPDGKKIAFLSKRDSTRYGIFMMDADGSGRTLVTPVNPGLYNIDGPRSPFAIDWSPDGTRLVFQDELDIAIVNIDGTGRRTITDASSYDMEPTWSPDGSTIVFARDLVGDAWQFSELSEIMLTEPDFTTYRMRGTRRNVDRSSRLTGISSPTSSILPTTFPIRRCESQMPTVQVITISTLPVKPSHIATFRAGRRMAR